MSDEFKPIPYETVRDNALSYGRTPSSPAIRPEDINEWKAAVSPTFKHYFKERYEELLKAYEELVQDYAINKMLYEASMGFQPKIGETYFLYNTERSGGFVSLVPPSNAFWGGYIGAFKLNAQYSWEKTDIK